MDSLTMLYVMGTKAAQHRIVDSLGDACEGLRLVRDASRESELKMYDTEKLNEAGNHIIDAIKCLMDSFVPPPNIDSNVLARLDAEVSEVISEARLWFV